MIYVMKGDITGLDFDLIVDPTRPNLLPGTGVNQEIHQKAGRRLLNELIEYAPLEEGKAVITDSYDLPCKQVIHTACPLYSFHEEDEQEILAACYWNTMAIAYEVLRHQSKPRLNIAFPEISTGAYGFPREEACQIAIRTIKELFSKYPEAEAIDVWFVLRDEASYMLYKKELRTGSPRLKGIAGIRKHLRMTAMASQSSKKKDEKEELDENEGLKDLLISGLPFSPKDDPSNQTKNTQRSKQMSNPVKPSESSASSNKRSNLAEDKGDQDDPSGNDLNLQGIRRFDNPCQSILALQSPFLDEEKNFRESLEQLFASSRPDTGLKQDGSGS